MSKKFKTNVRANESQIIIKPGNKIPYSSSENDPDTMIINGKEILTPNGVARHRARKDPIRIEAWKSSHPDYNRPISPEPDFKEKNGYYAGFKIPEPPTDEKAQDKWFNGIGEGSELGWKKKVHEFYRQQQEEEDEKRLDIYKKHKIEFDKKYEARLKKYEKEREKAKKNKPTQNEFSIDDKKREIISDSENEEIPVKKKQSAKKKSSFSEDESNDVEKEFYFE